MSFEDLTLKSAYDSDEDDILGDFYIPLISRAMRYDRLAGYFSSTVLAMTAKGVASFIQNNGKMQLVTCVQLTEQDRKAIENGLAEPEEAISKIMMTGLDLADQIQRDHVAALAWMIAQKNLEIKIAVPFVEDSGFLTDTLDKNSLYHQKVGILYDDSGNVVSFSGSVNETGKAWTDNIEEFKVFCSWKPGQNEYCANDARKFEKFWHGLAKSTKIFDLPTAVRERLLDSAPGSLEDTLGRLQKDLVSSPKLRDYQYGAVNRWLESDRRGIFEMATGTGKTWAAISCIENTLKAGRTGILVVVACPYTHLVRQWVDELAKWKIEAESAYGSSTSWETDLNNGVVHLNDGILQKLVIVTTHATFSSGKFTKMVRQCQKKALVVGDEVHKIGSEHHGDGLLDEYDYRLGLSATPERYFDDAGTKKIFDFFSKVVFKFGLDEAIQQGYLTHYLLFPHIIYLTDEESATYRELGQKIAIEHSKEHPDHDLLKGLLIKRSKVVKAAENKVAELETIMKEIGSLDHCLVYCSERQLEDISGVLHDMGVIFHRFTSKESTPERKVLLGEFERGVKDVLLAIKCLDEGVDVPSTQTAIILASSHNPIEFIQRRGRILRPHRGKKHAVIHDMIAFPVPLTGAQAYTDSEKDMIKKEFDRLKEFAVSSDNPEHSEDVISTFMKLHDL